MSAFLYLVDATVYDIANEAERVLRYATGLGFVTAPTDTPANTMYDARLEQAFEVVRSIYAPGTTQGQSKTGFGEVVLMNPDAQLDELIGTAFGGRPIVIRRGPATATSLSEFTTIFAGTMELAEFSTLRVTIKLRDNQALLQSPLQTIKYAGNNALPNGLEGTPADLAGKPKPLVFGHVLGIAPPLVNTARLVYQISAAAIETVDAVYVRGVPLVNGGTYASEAELMNDALAPSSFGFKVWRDTAQCFIRLGSSPDGIVTADATHGADPTARTAAQLYRTVLLYAGVLNSNVVAGDLTALDDVNVAELGVYVNDDTRSAAVLDQIANSVGAWWGENQFGVFRIARLERPTGVAVRTFVANDLIGPPVRQATNDPERGLPAHRVTVRYARNYTVQTTDVAGSVSDARRGEIAQAWREATIADDAVLLVYQPPVELLYETLMRSAADAQAEAARRLELRSIQRHRFQITTLFDDETTAIDLGDTVGLFYDRFLLSVQGNEQGQLFVVLGVEPNARSGRVTFTLWGNSLRTRNIVEAGSLTFLRTNDGAFLITNDS